MRRRAMEYITVREAAQKWKISERLAQQYCTDGRIEGAKKFGASWAIPKDAQKSADPRREKKESCGNSEPPQFVRTVQKSILW